MDSSITSKNKRIEIKHMIRSLREIWMKVGLKKVDTHKGIAVKVLLDSRTTEIFMNKKFTEQQGFKMEKLARLVKVRNVDRSYNMEGSVTYEVEVNVYYKKYVERAQISVCNLGKIEVILEML